MDQKKIDRILRFIREEMVANAPGAQGGFGSASDAKGPTAGFDPVMGKPQRRKKIIGLGPGSRKRWMKGNGKS